MSPPRAQGVMGDYYPQSEYLAGPADFKARGCSRG
jgi:hypothetical protein